MNFKRGFHYEYVCFLIKTQIVDNITFRVSKLNTLCAQTYYVDRSF